MNDTIKEWGPLVGRVMLSTIFLMSGLMKIGNFAGTSGYMANMGVPMSDIALAVTIIVEVGGAAMIIVGWNARLGAAALFLWMIPVSLMFHAFWAAPQAEMQTQMAMFMKNMAMMGAMLMIMAFGSGAKSLKAD